MKFKKTAIIIFLLTVITASAYFIFCSLSSNTVKIPIISLTKDSLPKVNPAKSFTVIVLPDIQNYSSTYPEILCQQTEWILAKKKDLNIVFVSELGDITNNGAKKMYEWENASRCLGKLDEVVPYSVIPGNHDADISGQKSSGFSAFDATFPASRFDKYSWYGGNYENNRNNYEIITVKTAGGSITKLLFLNLEIEPSDKVLAWADSVIKAHPDFYAILTTHKYLLIDSKARDNTVRFSSDGNSGEDIWNKLVKDNCSIAMVWSGHNHGENRISSVNSCENTVNEIVQDYQDRENGGNGWLSIYTFTPAKHSIDVRTYSPYLNQIETDADSQFTLEL